MALIIYYINLITDCDISNIDKYCGKIVLALQQLGEFSSLVRTVMHLPFSHYLMQIVNCF